MKKEKLILEFYRRVIFKKEFKDTLTLENCISMSIKQAYVSVQRVLNGIGEYSVDKKAAEDKLFNAFTAYMHRKTMTEVEFDKWHKELCGELIKLFSNYKRKNNTIGFTVGTAQKWINMTFKYLYTFTLDNSFGKKNIEEYFKHCHMALDSISLSYYKEQVNDKYKKSNKWSLLNDYSDYIDIQNKSRKMVKERYNNPSLTLFLKEFDIWGQYRN